MAKSDFTDGHSVDDQPALPREQDFYRRWSRRKADYLQARANAGNRDDAPATADDASADEDTEPCLPPLDSLNEHSDLSDFMGARVAEEIRLLALRKVFHTASFNVCDGLDDYAENYRNFEPLGDIVTAHLRHQLKRLQQMADDAEAEDENRLQSAALDDTLSQGSDEQSPDETQPDMTSLASSQDADPPGPQTE